MSEQTYSSNELVTAMCLWEAFMEMSRHEGTPAAEHLGQHGSMTIRGAIADLVKSCDDAWRAIEALEGEAPVFDWEWCPRFLRDSFTNTLFDRALDTQYGGFGQLDAGEG